MQEQYMNKISRGTYFHDSEMFCTSLQSVVYLRKAVAAPPGGLIKYVPVVTEGKSRKEKECDTIRPIDTHASSDFIRLMAWEVKVASSVTGKGGEIGK